MPSMSFLIDSFKRPIKEGSDVFCITKTDLYNIAKLKACFNYHLIKPLFIMILNLVRELKIEVLND